MPLQTQASIDFSTLPDTCPYIDGLQSRMEYKYIENCTASYNSALIKRGWRRFGNYFFRPLCEGCSKCESMATDVSAFKASKSQRRIMKKNNDTEVLIGRPRVTKYHIDLYNKYHKFKSEKSGWKFRAITPQNYYENYVEGMGDFGKEIVYIKDNKIIGIDYVDIVDDGLSAIYFFYDPDYNHLSLGTYSLLYQIELARMYELKHIYLGYYVKECPSLNYKDRYKPYTILDGNPEITDKPIWR